MARARHAHFGDDSTVFRRDTRAVLQLRAIPARGSRPGSSAEIGDAELHSRALFLDLPDGRGLRDRGHRAPFWQKIPSGGDMAGRDSAVHGAGGLSAHGHHRTGQPRAGTKLSWRYADVLRGAAASGRSDAARNTGCRIAGCSDFPRMTTPG